MTPRAIYQRDPQPRGPVVGGSWIDPAVAPKSAPAPRPHHVGGHAVKRAGGSPRGIRTWKGDLWQRAVKSPPPPDQPPREAGPPPAKIGIVLARGWQGGEWRKMAHVFKVQRKICLIWVLKWERTLASLLPPQKRRDSHHCLLGSKDVRVLRAQGPGVRSLGCQQSAVLHWFMRKPYLEKQASFPC